MAAPTYDTDLNDVTLAETTTGWSAYGGGASGLSASPDISMQGTNCVDKQISGADKGQYFDNGTGITLGSGDHVWVWLFCGTPGLTDSIQNKGASVLVGTASNAYCQYHVEGNDTYGAAGRVARCYPVDYSVRSTNTSPPYRTVTGSPGASPQVFGGGLVTTASVKGANVGIDAIRYGTGIYIIDGDGTTPATFAAAATYDNASTRRWGVLTWLGGTAYELQGVFVIGQSSAGTPTACRFEDSNKTVTFVDTIHSASDFTQVVVDHASTVVDWTSINFVAAGTTNKGLIVFNNASTVATLSSCGFSGIGTTTLRAGVTATGCTWNGAGQITQNSASLSGCVISNSTAATALLVDDFTAIDNIDFTSSGTGHAIEIASGTSHTLTAITFTGYAASNGSTGNEAVYVNIGSGTVTLYADSTFSYRTAGATVNIIAGARTATVTVTDDSGAPISGAAVAVYAKDATGSLPYKESVTISNSGTTATVTHTGHTYLDGDKALIEGASLWPNNGVHTITYINANSYSYTMSSAPGSSPTGTITSTYTAIYGTTDGNGKASVTRVFSTDQPVTGWARKSTTAPYYKTGPVTGSPISSTGDTELSALLLLDQ